MRLSVIVPAYREGEEAALQIHKLSRNPRVHEVVVSACDCSPSFMRGLRKIPKIKLLEAPKKGRGAQMNYGAAAAKGDLLLFLHADSQVAPGGLEEMTETMKAHSANVRTLAPRAFRIEGYTGGVPCERLRGDGQGEGVNFQTTIDEKDSGQNRYVGGTFRLKFNRSDWRYRLKAKGANLRSKVLGMPYGDQGYFVRREVFERLGGFQNLPLFEDVEFFDRLKREGPWVLLKSPVVTSVRRWEKQGYWKATLKNALWIVLYRLGVSPHWLAKRY